MSFYALLILGTFIGPFALSFDKKIHFYTYFKPLFIAILAVGTVFVIWDEYFTQNEIWGFNPDYLMGLYFGNLPIEEVSFFIVVPYSCVFIYEVLKGYFPNFNKKLISKALAFIVTLSGFLLGAQYMENWYTASACILAALLTIGVYFVEKKTWYDDFSVAYLLALVPFIIVNGCLTGMVTPEPIVWYSADHIMGTRIISIPVEDLFYNYDMLICVVLLYELLKKRSMKIA